MHNPSIIRARYIQTLLRVARDADSHDAARLVKSLTSEYRHPDTPADLMPFEAAAIDAVEALASTLASGETGQLALWERARAAATDWLNAAS